MWGRERAAPFVMDTEAWFLGDFGRQTSQNLRRMLWNSERLAVGVHAGYDAPNEPPYAI